MLFRLTLLFALVPFTFFAAAPMHGAGAPVLRSPDGRIEISFAVQASGQLTYAVRFRGKPVLDASKLGLDLEGAEVLGSEVTIAEARYSSGTDDYTLTNTKVSKVQENYSALTIHVIETGRAARAMHGERTDVPSDVPRLDRRKLIAGVIGHYSRALLGPTEEECGYEFKAGVPLVRPDANAADVELANRGADSTVTVRDDGQARLHGHLHVIAMHIVFDVMYDSRLVGEGAPMAGC